MPAPQKVSAASGDWTLPEQNVTGRRNEYQSQMGFGLFFFSDDGSTTAADKYRLLLESARYGDLHGFTAVWTPERHFDRFGGAGVDRLDAAVGDVAALEGDVLQPRDLDVVHIRGVSLDQPRVFAPPGGGRSRAGRACR